MVQRDRQALVVNVVNVVNVVHVGNAASEGHKALGGLLARLARSVPTPTLNNSLKRSMSKLKGSTKS